MMLGNHYALCVGLPNMLHMRAKEALVMERGSNGKKRGVAWVTWIRTIGVIVVASIALVYGTHTPAEREALLPVNAKITFTGAALEGDIPNQIALRLHNLIVLCISGDLIAASAYIDPKSRLAGQPEAVCGPVTGTVDATKATIYQFERVDATSEEATVYITTREPPHASERYTFYMRKVQNKWYFSVP
jgi:hypothetical protein